MACTGINSHPKGLLCASGRLESAIVPARGQRHVAVAAVVAVVVVVASRAVWRLIRRVIGCTVEPAGAQWRVMCQMGQGQQQSALENIVQRRDSSIS